MCVSVNGGVTQIAVLEGRQLIEHYLSRPADDVSEIHGNVYLAKVQNVLPGMEAAFVDIGTPKNAVLYQGDLQYADTDFEGKGRPRIEQVLKSKQTILAQVTKNPIAHKGARLTQEVSLPDRFVVLVPNSFYTIRAGENDKFYIDELSAQTKRVCTLAQGQYTVLELRDALVAALNAAGKAITGQYAVTHQSSTNRLQISLVNAAAGDQYRVWPQRLLETSAGSWSLTAATLNSANRALGFMDGSAQLSGGALALTVTSPNAPNVQPYSQLFMRSNLGGSSTESLGPNYENDIVRRIVVGNTPQNSMIVDQHATESDCVKLSGSQEATAEQREEDGEL